MTDFTPIQSLIGGTLYSDALSDADGPAATYIDMMQNNIGAIKGAILGS